MKSTFKIACFMTYLLFAFNSFSQTIHKNDLLKLKVLIEFDWKTGTFAKQFKKYSITESFKPTRQFKALVVSKHDEVPILFLEKSDLAIVLLHDFYGFTSQAHCLTFWNIDGDSLRFDYLVEKRYDTSIGGISITGGTELTDDSILLVFHDRGGDAGDYWGGYSFKKYNKGQLPEQIYSRRYEGNSFGNYSVLACMIEKDSPDVIAMFVEKFYNVVNFEEHLAKIETTYVNLSQLPKEPVSVDWDIAIPKVNNVDLLKIIDLKKK